MRSGRLDQFRQFGARAESRLRLAEAALRLSETHATTARALRVRGDLRRFRSDLEGAEAEYERALGLFEAEAPRQHAGKLACMQNCRQSILHAGELSIRTAEASRYVERLGDAVLRDEEGRCTLDDPTFGHWLRWRRPGGAVVPMALVGDDAEKQVAAALAAMGFDLVYQSRASRGAFDLLATRGAAQLGLQVKHAGLPLRFGKASWTRMDGDARRLGWYWLVAAVGPERGVTVLDPAGARHGAEVRLAEEAAIDNVLEWLSSRPRPEPA